MIRGLFGRLLAVMCGVAAASTGLALLLQERSLSADLERAADRRLDQAAVAAERMLEDQLAAMAERYRAVSGTPQLRATLEVDDAPTLAHYARTLLDQQSAERIAFVDAKGRVVAGAGASALDAAALAVPGAGVVAHAGRGHLVVSTPLSNAGRLVAVESVDAALLARWSQLVGARVSFERPDAAGGEGLRRSVRRVGGLELRVASSLLAEREAMRHARLNLALGAALGLAVAFSVSFVLSRRLLHPIHEIQAAARRIGAGDLTARVATDRGDEIGDVARAFEAMTGELRGTLRLVAEAADRVEAKATSIGQGARRFLDVSQEQARGNRAAMATLEEIEGRVNEIAHSAGQSAHGLDLAVDGSSASFRQLAESGDALRENAAGLRAQCDEIARSLELVAASAVQVAGDTDALLPAVETTRLGLSEMVQSARSVNEHAQETSRLSGSVVETAERGRRIVRDAVQGMESTRATIEESERVIGSLRERTAQIGKILTVIEDVTDETSLLALNAAIIAAQAGESGKSFAVVASQMKALARRVQASTMEISDVVSAVQGESSDAVESIARGTARARAGVELIRQAESSLAEITRAARESGDRMAESAVSTAQQMGAADAVAGRMQAVHEGVERIRSATREQAEANEVVQRSSDTLHRVAQAVQGTVDDQTRGTARIGESVEVVQRSVREITKGLEEQVAASRQVGEVVQRSAELAGSHETSAAEMGGNAADLAREAEALRESVRRFRA